MFSWESPENFKILLLHFQNQLVTSKVQDCEDTDSSFYKQKSVFKSGINSGKMFYFFSLHESPL